MANFLQSLGRIISAPIRGLNNAYQDSLYGPDWRQRAAFLEAQQHNKLDQDAADLDYRRALADIQRANRYKVLQDFSADAAYGAAKTDIVPEQKAGASAVLGGDYRVNLPPSTHTETSIGDFQLPSDLQIGDPEALKASGRGEAMQRIAKERMAAQKQQTTEANVLSQIESRGAHTSIDQMLAPYRRDRLARQPSGPRPQRDRVALGTDDFGNPAIVNLDTGSVSPVNAGAGGFRRTPPSLAERQGSIGIDNILSDVDRIAGIVEGNPNAVGLGQWVLGNLRQRGLDMGGDPDAFEVQTLVAEGLTQRLRELSGAAVSPSEANRLMKTMPDPRQDPDFFLQRLQMWKDDLERSAEAYRMGGRRAPRGTSRTTNPGAAQKFRGNIGGFVVEEE
jgi:hypothetical protein